MVSFLDVSEAQADLRSRSVPGLGDVVVVQDDRRRPNLGGSVGFWLGGHDSDHPDHAAAALLQVYDVPRGPREWQDVYHVPSEAGVLYVKFRADIVTEFLLLSFKDRADG